VLTILAEYRGGAGIGKQALCMCHCGRLKTVPSRQVLANITKSCGCLHRKHGHSGKHVSPTYHSWLSMIKRCEYPACNGFNRYGGAGVKVCERWHVFANFLADMGERPEGRTLDRYPDARGNYEPGNCRWATRIEQARGNRKFFCLRGHSLEVFGRPRGNGQRTCGKCAAIRTQKYQERKSLEGVN
jgi:hypothetical protein